jgi:hypothetical protein
MLRIMELKPPTSPANGVPGKLTRTTMFQTPGVREVALAGPVVPKAADVTFTVAAFIVKLVGESATTGTAASSLVA